jgi:hypothetical protein
MVIQHDGSSVDLCNLDQDVQVRSYLCSLYMLRGQILTSCVMQTSHLGFDGCMSTARATAFKGDQFGGAGCIDAGSVHSLSLIENFVSVCCPFAVGGGDVLFPIGGPLHFRAVLFT